MIVDLVLYWPTQAAIDNNRPIIVEAERVVEVGGLWYVHGTSHTVRGIRYCAIYGHPADVGADDSGIELAATPAVGKCTLTIPAHGAIFNHVAAGYPLTSGVWTTLVGGSIGSGAAGVAWDGGTGTITLERAGNWDIVFSLAAEWAVGPGDPRIEVALWNMTGTPSITAIQSSISFNNLGGDGRSCSAGLPLTLVDGTLLQLRVQSDQTGSLDVRHFSVGLKRQQ